MPLTLPQLEGHFFKVADTLRGKFDVFEFKEAFVGMLCLQRWCGQSFYVPPSLRWQFRHGCQHLLRWFGERARPRP